MEFIRLEEIKNWLNKQLQSDALETLKPYEVKYEICQTFNNVSVSVTTSKNKYSISASNEYLGCTATDIKTGKGNDLADGKFYEGTWNSIVDDMVTYEKIS